MQGSLRVSPARSAPEVLLQPCAPLPEVEDGRLSSLIENHVASVRLYHECAQRHADLVEVVRSADDAPAAGLQQIWRSLTPTTSQVLDEKARRP